MWYKLTIGSTISSGHLSNISFSDYFGGKKAGLKKVKLNFKYIVARKDQLFENHALTFCPYQEIIIPADFLN